MVWWHHQLNGHEFEQAPRVGNGQGSRGMLQSTGRIKSDMTEQMNWTELNWTDVIRNWILSKTQFSQFSSVAQSCQTLRPRESQHTRPPCPSPTPRVYSNSCPLVGDAIQPSHPLSSPSPPAPNLSQHQCLFQWVNSSHEVVKVLEFQLQHQSFQ